MAFLVVQEPGSLASTIPLRDGFRLGRDPACDLCMGDVGVSRVHAEIIEDGDGFALVDLGSRHGVFVNEEKIERRLLHDGDKIRVGSSRLSFRTTAPETSMETIHRRATSFEPTRPEGDSVDTRRLRLLYEVSSAVGALGNPDDLLRTMMDAILDVLQCERCVVGFAEGARTTRRIVRTRDGGTDENIVVSATLLGAILGRREAVLVRDAADANTPNTVIRDGIRSAMGVPLGTSRRQFGYLYVDDRGASDRFGPEDVDFLIALSRLTAAALESAEGYQRLADEAAALQAETASGEIIGTSEPMRRLRVLLDKYAAADSHVLVRGESGTGKELAAKAIHARSPRAERAFVAVNCAAIPDTMIESELFGHEKGAFTGATKDRRGKFVLAHKGTLFLDEVGDLSLSAQAKLLRVVQEGEVQPLGSERTTRVDVRIVAATHKDLDAEVKAGRFREDLFYRLAVVELEMPPLRERGEDVVALAQALLQRIALRMGKQIQGFTDGAAEALTQYAWPGNVRQLANEMERAAILAEDGVVGVDLLSTRVGASAPAAAKGDVATPPEKAASGIDALLSDRYARLEDLEKVLVEEAIRAANGNQSEAARLLGVSRIVLRRRIERFGLAGATSQPERPASR